MNAMNSQQPGQAQYGSQPMAAAPPALELEVWGATDKGQQREGNEDAVYPNSGVDSDLFEPGPEYLSQKGRLLIVADGVGGARAGSQASQWAIRVAVETYYDQPGADLGSDLRTAIEQANNSLYQYLQSTGTQEAGSTMTAAVVHGNTLHVANVGDSRTYLLRNGQLTQLTRDHTLTQQKLARGLIRPDQVEMDPDRSVLTRSMGAGPTVQVDVFPPQQLGPGDAVLLCSDGLTDMVGDQEIARLLDRHGPKRAVKKLIDAANKNGGFDNISVIVAQAGGNGAAGGGLLAGVGGLAGSIGDLSKRQKLFVGGGAVLVAAVLCGMTALGWSMSNKDNPTKTPVPAATTPAVTANAPAATTPAATPTPQATDTVPAGAATSTPQPTLTPTNTSPPPPTPKPIPTETPTPEPPTPEPNGGGGGSGNGGGGNGGGGGDEPPDSR